MRRRDLGAPRQLVPPEPGPQDDCEQVKAKIETLRAGLPTGWLRDRFVAEIQPAELHELRRRRRACITCGRRLPRYPEQQDGRAHSCFACLWRRQHGIAFACERCPSCNRVLLWSGGRLVCGHRPCPRWGMGA